jgi:antitoxin component YwqK of YwqJK toxin-antitoxin module
MRRFENKRIAGTKVLAIFFLGNSTLLAQQSFPSSPNPVNASYAGVPDGPDEDYFINGQVRSKCTIKGGNVDGERISYYRHGQFFLREMFANGEYNGINYALTEHGDSLYYEEYAHDSLLASKEWRYYKSGKLKSVSTTWFVKDSSMKKGLFPGKDRFKVYTMDENKMEQLVHNTNIDVDYYENGKIKSYIEYKNGNCHGKYILYYENGNVKQNSPCKDGKWHGPYLEYYENGWLKIRTTNKDDYYDGEYFEYDKQGVLKKYFEYKEGKILE